MTFLAAPVLKILRKLSTEQEKTSGCLGLVEIALVPPEIGPEFHGVFFSGLSERICESIGIISRQFRYPEGSFTLY